MPIDEKLFNTPPIEVLFGKNNWVLRNTVEAINESIEVFKEQLTKDSYWNENEIKDLMLGFHEALVNAKKHGNKEEEGKHIYVLIDITPEALFLQIRDDGGGYDPTKVPNPLASENLMKTSGRGLLMLKSFFDKVELQGNGNIIVLTKFKNKEKKDEKQKSVL